MNKRIYAVYDRVSHIFSEQPFVSVSDSVAIRDFSISLGNSPLKDDLSLYCVGMYDNETGVVVPFDRPEFVSEYIPYGSLNSKGEADS